MDGDERQDAPFVTLMVNALRRLGLEGLRLYFPGAAVSGSAGIGGRSALKSPKAGKSWASVAQDPEQR